MNFLQEGGLGTNFPMNPRKVRIRDHLDEKGCEWSPWKPGGIPQDIRLRSDPSTAVDRRDPRTFFPFFFFFFVF